ncbi:HTH-type transcriptional regulator GbpR [Rhodobacteraceae bacterium THAF1]|uniref:LysR family transcriptional regulator n=1 Tax=Palleronia sp. THAF1 TaxID=2587842 RepID=UPI000F3D1F69|nr:LysR family transcriptional regulator [Palleronia sp. THAF1]QFU08095.1 HTH-type transcriptional regulator GbpR [Palleronia sp. THAF1]VDC27953.1 HTH-type transcriptional regulator GbpR [Rhodobacteraceae bacterium THAF1]
MSRTDARTDRLTGHLIRKGVKLTHLQLIACLKETEQILAAAEMVGMTQPAASRLLSQLESATGATLFNRHPRGVRLTEAGEVLANGAIRLLADLDLTQSRLLQSMHGETGLVRVGSVTGPSLKWLLPVIHLLRRDFPQIELAVHVDTSTKLAVDLLSRELDFFIGRVPDGTDGRPFLFNPVREEPISLVVRQGHPLAQKPKTTLEECMSFDWVMQPPGGLLRQTTETYLVSRGYRLPEHVIGTSSTLFTLGLIHTSDAIAPLASDVAEFFVRDTALAGRLETLNVAPDLRVKTFGLVRRSDDDLSPAAQRVHDMLMEHVA